MPDGEAKHSRAVARPAIRSLSDYVLALRDDWLASPGFRRAVAAFPLTRIFARRRSAALFDLCAGFVYSQILLACVRLRLFDTLAEGPKTNERLALQLDLPPEAMLTLLRAACALGLVEKRSGERYGLGPLGGPLVDESAVPAMVQHHAILYGDLKDPLSMLRDGARNTALRRFWPYAREANPAALSQRQVESYTVVMAQSQRLVADQAIAAYSFRRDRRLMDVGGGNGAFLAAVGERWPHLDLVLFDLPAVAASARRTFDLHGLTGRAASIGGDFLSGELPRGADVISLVRILHDHDDEAAGRILRAARAALPAGGTLLVVEPISGAPAGSRVSDAYFGLYLFAMGQGRTRTFEELRRLIVDAGFAHARLRRTPLPIVASAIVTTA